MITLNVLELMPTLHIARTVPLIKPIKINDLFLLFKICFAYPCYDSHFANHY